MTLIVEDGTGRADAESYASVADADAYMAARNLTLWADAGFTATEKEAVLRRATDFMEQSYRLRWAGVRNSDTQALAWPRYLVPKPDASLGYGVAYYPTDAVPPEVKRACLELAWRAAFADLAPDLGQEVTSKSVGPIKIDYRPGSPQAKRFAAVIELLAPLFATASGGGSIRVARA
jgi:hypothetical protein